MAQTYRVELEETELKLLLVAMRQVQHTLTIAEQQSSAAGETLAADYSAVQESYQRLEARLAALLSAPAGSAPHRMR